MEGQLMAPKKKRKVGALHKRARRDVRLASQPYLKAIKREGERGRRDYEQAESRVSNIYDALRQQLAPMQGQYDQQAQQISGDFTKSLGGLTDLLGTTGPPAPDAAPWEGRGFAPTAGEGQAAANALGGIGATGQMLLSSDRSRQAGYQMGTERQAEVERATLRRNYLEDYRDLVQELGDRKIDLKGDWQSQIIARLDELRDKRWQKNMQERELDIAEGQFNKTFGLQKKQFKSTQQLKNRKQDWAESAFRREEETTLKKKLSKQIDALLGERKEIRKRIENFQPSPSSSVQPIPTPEGGFDYYDPKLGRLKKKKRKLTKTIRRKKQRRRNL